jgi:hypothetical protein
MLSQEQKLKLTPEELIIAEKWEREKEELANAYKMLSNLIKEPGNDAAYDFYSEKIAGITPSICEHGKSVFLKCEACNDLSIKLYPERYIKCDSCGNLINVGDKCFNCDDCWK